MDKGIGNIGFVSFFVVVNNARCYNGSYRVMRFQGFGGGGEMLKVTTSIEARPANKRDEKGTRVELGSRKKKIAWGPRRGLF